MLRLKEEEALSNLQFTIEQFLKQYGHRVEKLKLQRESLELFKRKLIIQERQLAIGEIKRIDYLESQSEYLEDVIQALQNQLAVLEMERSFEQLIGVEPATLRFYAIREQKED